MRPSKWSCLGGPLTFDFAHTVPVVTQLIIEHENMFGRVEITFVPMKLRIALGEFFTTVNTFETSCTETSSPVSKAKAIAPILFPMLCPGSVTPPYDGRGWRISAEMTSEGVG